MEGYDPSTYGEAFADVYDDWYGDVTDAPACAVAVASLASDARSRHPGTSPPLVLELGIGTGRIAKPLLDEGVDIRGIDASPAMIEALRSALGDAVAVAEADFARPIVPARNTDPQGVSPRVDCVLFAYNTFFSLTDEAEQRGCLATAAQLVSSSGYVVVEAFVPPVADELDHRSDADAVRVRHLTTDLVVLTAAVHDASRQTLSGQYVELRSTGTRLRPWFLRYLHPEQLDHLAVDAGLELVHRWSDWDRKAFGPTSDNHISVYRSSS